MLLVYRILLVFLLLFSLYMLFLFFNLMWAMFTGPPIVYASRQAVEDVIRLGKLNKNDVFVDLGCGNGQTLIHAVKKYNCQAIGIDRSLYCYLATRFNSWRHGCSDRITIHWGDFSKYPEVIKRADVIYTYLWPSTMRALESYIFDNKKPDCRVVSISFLFNRPYRIKMPTRNLGANDNTYLYK